MLGRLGPRRGLLRSPSQGCLLQLQQRFASTFQKLGLSPPLLAAVSDLKLSSPTGIQEAAFPVLQSGANTVLTSYTGSGKTLAYMLPMVQRLRKEEEAAGDTWQTRLRRPVPSSSVPAANCLSRSPPSSSQSHTARRCGPRWW